MTSDQDVPIDVLLNIASSEASLAFFEHQHDRREQRVLECMTAAGLDDVEPFPGDPFSGLSRVELARLGGFGYWSSLDLGGQLYAEPARSASPNDELLATLDLLERAVWLATHQRCVNDAVQGTVMVDRPETQRALDQFNADVHEHPIVVAAHETWRRCMAAVGYGDFDDWQTDTVQKAAWYSAMTMPKPRTPASHAPAATALPAPMTTSDEVSLNRRQNRRPW